MFTDIFLAIEKWVEQEKRIACKPYGVSNNKDNEQESIKSRGNINSTCVTIHHLVDENNSRIERFASGALSTTISILLYALPRPEYITKRSIKSGDTFPKHSKDKFTLCFSHLASTHQKPGYALSISNYVFKKISNYVFPGVNYREDYLHLKFWIHIIKYIMRHIFIFNRYKMARFFDKMVSFFFVNL